MSDNFLITGGCGFIGISLIRQLLELDPATNIRILDNLSVGTREDLQEISSFREAVVDDIDGDAGVCLVVGDIRDQATAEKCAAGIDCIVHLAANTGVGPSVEEPRMDMESNVIGTFNMLEAARIHCVSRFIFASSGAPAGTFEPPIHEELPPHPVSPYGASKLAGEGYCSAYSQTFGIGTVCLRFGNVFGPRSKKKSSVVAKFIRQAFEGQVSEIYGDGTQTRDFIYIDDLVNAIILSIKKDVGGETFQIASGKEHTVLEIADIIAEVIKESGKTFAYTHQQPRLGDVKRNYSDVSKALTVLGWAPAMELKTGIENTVEYFIQQYR